jgi:hypothetical protein
MATRRGSPHGDPRKPPPLGNDNTTVTAFKFLVVYYYYDYFIVFYVLGNVLNFEKSFVCFEKCLSGGGPHLKIHLVNYYLKRVFRV